jgi:hypothetical protein
MCNGVCMFFNNPCTPPNITSDNRQLVYAVFRKDTADLRLRTCCSQFNCHRTQKKVGKYSARYVLCTVSFMYVVVAI